MFPVSWTSVLTTILIFLTHPSTAWVFACITDTTPLMEVSRTPNVHHYCWIKNSLPTTRWYQLLSSGEPDWTQYPYLTKTLLPSSVIPLCYILQGQGPTNTEKPVQSQLGLLTPLKCCSYQAPPLTRFAVHFLIEYLVKLVICKLQCHTCIMQCGSSEDFSKAVQRSTHSDK